MPCARAARAGRPVNQPPAKDQALFADNKGYEWAENRVSVHHQE